MMGPVNQILDYCTMMTHNKKDFVVVGSVALVLLGLQKEDPKDIDIVVNDLSGIEGNVKEYTTDSKFSNTGRRAYILDEVNPKVDIFIEESLPDSIMIKGIRTTTRKAMLEYYSKLLPIAGDIWKDYILNKIKILELWPEKI